MDARTDIEQPTDDISSQRDPTAQESVRNVRDRNRLSKRKPRNIRQVLSSHSQNPSKYHRQQSPPQQQQQQYYGNAKVTGKPSLLVRRGTLRNSKQKPKPKKARTSKQKKQLLIHLKKKISKVQGKISDELRKSESDKTSLIGKYTCKNILHFVMVYSVLLCLRSAIEAYTEGMAHQVEQKYYFSHSSLDVLSGVKLIGFLGSITYVIFFTRNSHKPLLICLGAFLCGLGAIIWPVPYYIDGQSYSQSLTQCGDQPTVGFYYSEMCHYRNRSRLNDMTQPNADICSVCVLKNKSPWWDAREARFSAMCVGGFLIGLGTGLFATLGIVYIEENGDQDTCPLYYGILMSMTGLGKFLGSCFVWWFLGYTEDLTVKSKLDPWEIRAWWLGMVILSIILLFISWVFLIFPKWLNEPLWLSEKRQQKLKYLDLYLNYLNSKAQKSVSDLKSISNRRSQTSSNNRSRSQNVDESQQKSFAASNGLLDFIADPYSADDNPVVGDVHQIVTSTVEIEDPKDRVAVKPRRTRTSKKLGKHCSRLRDVFMVPGFTLALLGVCFAAYFPAGYRTAMSKYVHHQYQFPPNHSWFYTMGLSYSLAWCIGPAIGSVIIYRLQLTLRKQLIMLMLLLTFHMSLFFFMFPINCQPKMEMQFSASVQRCMDVCSCANVQREAICNSDGTMYSSPCHASCSISLTCNCTSTEISADNCIGNCPIYGLYWIFIFFATVIFSTGSVSVILFFLRTVEEDYKSMSISVAFWMVVVAAFVPGSAVFNGIADSSCSEYRKNCLSEMICSSYVPDQLRYVVNGSNVAFQGGAFFVFLIVFLLSTTRKINFGQDSVRLVRLSLPENVDEDDECEPRVEKRVRATKSNSSRVRSKVGEDEGQVERLRRHLQLVQEVEMRVELERSSSNADIPAGRTRNEVTPTSSSNFQEGMTQSNDSSTQRLIEASQQQPKTRPQATTSSTSAELPKERPLSNKEFVESYLSSIPDDFVYSREVSMENDVVAPGRVVVDPMDIRLGVDNLAYDPREYFLSKIEVPRTDQARKSRSSNPDEILFM